MTRKPKKLISMKECTDRMWSENAKCRAGHRCAFTEATEGLNSHHIYGRKSALRYSHANAIVIASWLHKFRFHNASYMHESMMKAIEYNGTSLEHLESLKNDPEKISLQTYYDVERDEFIEHLTAGRVKMTPRLKDVLDFIEVRNSILKKPRKVKQLEAEKSS